MRITTLFRASVCWATIRFGHCDMYRIGPNCSDSLLFHKEISKPSGEIFKASGG